MNTTSRNSKSFKPSPSLTVNDELRDLVAAMPVVIFAKALKAALERPAAARVALRPVKSS